MLFLSFSVVVLIRAPFCVEPAESLTVCTISEENDPVAASVRLFSGGRTGFGTEFRHFSPEPSETAPKQSPCFIGARQPPAIREKAEISDCMPHNLFILDIYRHI
jgi:hypothetical protein